MLNPPPSGDAGGIRDSSLRRGRRGARPVTHPTVGSPDEVMGRAGIGYQRPSPTRADPEEAAVGAGVRLLSAVLVARQVLQGPDETRPRRRRIPSSSGLSLGPDVPGGRAATPI